MLEPGTLIGKYVVRRKLAEGGMAEIYLCSVRGPEGFEKDVVIKRIRPMFASDANFVEMFINEARLLSRLNHANLVQIFDFDKHQDTYYLAMEYVHGRSLWELRKRLKEVMEALPPTLAAHICAQVARGLAHAHALHDKGKSLNLVHRDVTPHNVLVSFDGAVKLTDFGVAKHSASATSAGVLKGKYAYMSPEQARGESVDARTDLFALGIVLWEMLTGGRLFDGDSDVAVLRAVQTSAIAPPSRLNPAVPGALNDIVMTALQRAPEARYQTGAQMDRALQEFVLSHARSLDDTDLPAYLRRLFPEDDATKIAAAPVLEHEVPAPTTFDRSPPADATGLSADEDMHAPTVAPAGTETVSGRRANDPTDSPRTLPVPDGRRWRLTVGMRRALWTSFGVATLIAAAGGVISARQGPLPDTSTASGAVPDALPPPAPDPVPPVDAAPEPELPLPEKEAAPAPPPSPGTLVLRVRPYASVAIDGKHVREVAGLSSFRLSPGQHVITLTHSRGVKEIPVVIEPGKDTTVEHAFVLR